MFTTRNVRRLLTTTSRMICLLFAADSAFATAINLTPLSLSITMPERAVGLTISNQAPEAATLQVRVMRWSQDAGRNLYAPAEGWVVSPPVINVQGGRSQLLRVIRRSDVAVEQEETYRVFVDELPAADAPNTGAVRVLMRYSLPLFVMPAKAVLPDVYWGLQTCGSTWFLNADNRGQRHLKLLGYRLSQGKKVLVQTGDGLLGYVLPGQSYRWEGQGKWVEPGSDAGLTVRVSTDQGEMEAPVTLVKGPGSCPGAR